MPYAPRQRHALPKTAFDHNRRNAPLLIEHAAQVAATLTPIDRALSVQEIGEIPMMILGKSMLSLYRSILGPNGRHFDDRTIVDRLDPGTSEALMAEVRIKHWTTTNFCLYGSQTYYVHGNIVPLLATTHINVDADSFVLPAPCCMLVFDDDESRRVAYQDHPVPSLQETAAPISVILMQEPSLLVEGATDVQVLATQQTEQLNLSTWIKRFTLLPGKTLDESLRTSPTEEQLNALDPDWKSKQLPEMGVFNRETEFQGKDFDFIRMIVNAALYLTSHGADMSEVVDAPSSGLKAAQQNLPRKQRERLEAEQARSSRLSYIYVGKNIEPIAVEREETMPLEEPGEGRKLEKRFSVRAHKRWQRVGPGLSQIRLTDVKSYEKGPDAAEVLHRRAVLKLHPDALVVDEPSSPSPR